MSAHDGIEIERKYDVGEDAVVPSLTGVAGVASVRDGGTALLDAIYLDTEGRELLPQRVVVRRRVGGHDAGWHIKSAEGDVRHEQQWPLGDADREPEELRARIATRLREPAAPLVPLARLVTTRTTLILLDAEGGAVAEVADDRVTAVEDATGEERSWREWEVELLDAAPEGADADGGLLDAVQTELLAAGARPSSSVAKIARALGLG
ncbi:CYTH domain-containing protein [Mycetocola reblochoni]|uniref:CHAD domain containing protein n=2 Tax=Mycetocola reblochoni TaxID=331618 RepID=A0A1R4JNJ8_9MICO|nr:CYTH domain-containing protein [Mycetocola reblochoni]RLP68612.1 CYTH domain-containing protein [Mycetocola reblochoni]SJN33542.1 CHAD domain containing protein [Mycetocola reblochoni REB411]